MSITPLDFFAAHSPAPSTSDIDHEMAMDAHRNPHNDSYKPERRTRVQIEAQLRYRSADAMMAERKKRLAEGLA